MPVPYRIRIADDVLKDLKARLRNTRWPDQLEGTGRVPPPREVCERRYTIARWTQTDKGGHFLEQEEPQLVADDMCAFIGALTIRGATA